MYKHLLTTIILFVFVLITACGGGRADTVEMPAATTAPIEEPTEVPTEVPPTEEPEAEPTQEPEPTVTEPPTKTPEPTETPEPTSTPEPINTALDEEALMASLLTISDMPTGWTGSAPESEQFTPGDTYTFTCKELVGLSLGNVGVEFQKGGFGPFLGHKITVYENADDAKTALSDLSGAASECLSWTDKDGNENAISPLSFPDLGDGTFAARMSGNFEADAVYIREGNVVISILNFAFPVGVDSELTEEMAILAIERFQDNN